MKQKQFWNNYKKLIKDVVLEYQYLVMLDKKDIHIEREREDLSLPNERSQAITNFKIVAGLVEGEHYGWWFQDTDVYKWIETAAYTLTNFNDDALKQKVDDVIDIIGLAQEDSGYLSTYYQLRAPHLKYKELDRSHELYNAGHLIEAAVAYYEATKEEKLLDIAIKFVKNIKENFGDNKIEGADGHQEIELALIKLYQITGNKTYLDLSRYFIDIRGAHKDFYNEQKKALGQDHFTNLEYLQAYDKPINQKEAKGHAVRMLYMMEAMADLAYLQNDKEMKQAVFGLWNDIVNTKMYVTGGVGQTVKGEAFAESYELPNDTMYCETCAAIGMINTAKRLFKLNQDDTLIDVMERAIYNGMLSGMSQDGEHFFYVNPLEYIKDRYSPDKGHVKGQRPQWLGCACCPPNISRTIASIDSYFYSQIEQDIYIHMYGDAKFNSSEINIVQTSSFPVQDNHTLKIKVKEKETTLHFRTPNWAKKIDIKLDGQDIKDKVTLKKGEYLIKVKIENKPLAIYTSSNVVHNANRVAFQFGPFIYCGETVDQQTHIYKYFLDPKTIDYQLIQDDLGLRYNLEVTADKKISSDQLYITQEELSEKAKVNLIPYYLWANRGLTDMMVWLFRK